MPFVGGILRHRFVLVLGRFPSLLPVARVNRASAGMSANHRLFATLPGLRAGLRTKPTPAISHDQGRPYTRSEPTKGSFSLGLESTTPQRHYDGSPGRPQSRAESQPFRNAVASSASTNLRSNPSVGPTHIWHLASRSEPTLNEWRPCSKSTYLLG